MSVNYLTLMLVNMTAGLFLLAAFFIWGLKGANPKRWAAGFLPVALVALLTGLHTTFTWPLAGSYNIAYGEMSVLFGAVYLAAAAALLVGADLLAVGLYAAFAGAAAIVVGVQVMLLRLTMAPMLSGLGFILTGFGGVLASLVIGLRRFKVLRAVAAAVLILAGAIWAVTGYGAYYSHMERFRPEAQPAPRGGASMETPPASGRRAPHRRAGTSAQESPTMFGGGGHQGPAG